MKWFNKSYSLLIIFFISLTFFNKIYAIIAGIVVFIKCILDIYMIIKENEK